MDTQLYTGSNVAGYLARAEEEEPAELLAALEAASGKGIKKASSSTIVTWRLKTITGAPAKLGDDVITLRYIPDRTAANSTSSHYNRNVNHAAVDRPVCSLCNLSNFSSFLS